VLCDAWQVATQVTKMRPFGDASYLIEALKSVCPACSESLLAHKSHQNATVCAFCYLIVESTILIDTWLVQP